MARPVDQVLEVLEFGAAGLSHREISARTGVPVNTLRHWLHGRLPAGALARMGGEEPCATCGGPHALPADQAPEAYCYLLGQYLGDGHIVESPRVAVLRIYSDAKYPRIIGECFRAIRDVMPTSRVNVFRRGTKNAIQLQSYAKAWPCLFPQHGPGRKHTRRIALTEWQEELTSRFPGLLIRGLIHSDGTRSVNRVGGAEYPRYLFSNRSADIRAIFTDHLDLLGIDWRPMGPFNVSVARRAGVEALDRLVGPKR